MSGEATKMELDFKDSDHRCLNELAERAWIVREHSYLIGDTKVGAAVMAKSGSVFVGCNVEHRFRCHDIHAEVNAIGAMVTGGHADLIAVVVVADRERFTPCGGCMDWIYQFGGAHCLVGFQRAPDVKMEVFRARDLMPFYPV